MQKASRLPGKPDLSLLYKIFGGVLFLYLFLGFMVVPCINTLTSVFTANGDR